MYTSGDETVVVLDVGTSSIRCGYAGEDSPRFVFPSAVGVYSDESMIEASLSSIKFPLTYFKRECDLKADPVVYREAGEDEDEKLKKRNIHITPKLLNEQHLLHTLQVLSSSKCMGFEWKDAIVCITEPAETSTSYRKVFCKCLFDDLRVAACYVAKEPTLMTFAVGRTSSLTCDMGSSHLTTAAIQEGYCLPSSIVSFPLGGDVIDDLIQSQLKQQGVEVRPPFEHNKSSSGDEKSQKVDPSYYQEGVREQLRLLKESHCRVMEDSRAENWTVGLRTQPFTLPDGTIIEPDVWMSKIPEILFAPKSNAVGNIPKKIKRFPGISKMLCTSLEESPDDAKKEVYAAIAVGGGGCCMSGLNERLAVALAGSDAIGTTLRYKIIASPSLMERRFASWLGASILGSLGSFSGLCVTAREWKEGGEKVMERKCP